MTEKCEKTCFNVETNDFDQGLAGGNTQQIGFNNSNWKKCIVIIFYEYFLNTYISWKKSKALNLLSIKFGWNFLSLYATI